MNTTRTLTALPLLAVLSLVGCASNSDSTHPVEENAISHAVTEQDKALAASKAPLKGDSALLYVNGMGCPLCASNIDLQLVRLDGVSSVNVDLGHGTAFLKFSGADRPSPHAIGVAVKDAGFTLVKIESPAPAAGGAK